MIMYPVHVMIWMDKKCAVFLYRSTLNRPLFYFLTDFQQELGNGVVLWSLQPSWLPALNSHHAHASPVRGVTKC